MKSPSSVRRDCDALAPSLTALFDGEADPAQAGEARAHLLVCAACSRSWLDWTQHRATLQSVPVPPPPPTLLWRVLIAYRIAAFARPARRRSRLPHISAAPLRDIEAPLPPRLSQHILERTTRQPKAHVLLTPLHGAPRKKRAPWKARATNFRRVSMVAAPALALWLLMLGRADFNALVPVSAPNTPSESAILAGEIAPNSGAFTAQIAPEFAPIPVAPPLNSGAFARSPISALSRAIARGSSRPAPNVNAPRQSRARVLAVASARATGPARGLVSAPNQTSGRIERALPVNAPSRASQALDRAVLLAMSASARDLARTRAAASAPRASFVSIGAPLPLNENRVRSAAPTERSASGRGASGRGASGNARLASAVTRPSSTDGSFIRVSVASISPASASRGELGALTSPLASARTLSMASVRPATFSEEVSRPRVTFASASGRRLARLMPEESATPLRLSRPVGGAPTLRPAGQNNDNSPRIDELRSAVDEFRASISDDRLNDD